MVKWNTFTQFMFLVTVIVESDQREQRQLGSLFGNLFGHGHGHSQTRTPAGRNDTVPEERLRDAFTDEDGFETFLLGEVDLGTVAIVQQDCCLFLFLDGSAYHFDDFLRQRTGDYQLQPGRVNGFPHYASRKCRVPSRYSSSCTYIWSHNGRWVVGDGRYIGQTKGVMYSETPSDCPTGLSDWKYLDEDLGWRDNGRITLTCSAK